MCEANAYITTGGSEELYLESVDLIRPEAGGTLVLRNLFGEQKVFTGRLKEISLRTNRILLEPNDGPDV